MHSTNTEQSNFGARATDPITSKMARKSETLEARILGALISNGPMTCWELVKCLNEMRESYTHDRQPREITIDSVSTCMRPMCRRGEVHEAGTKENTVRDTGNQVIVWAAGPSPDWQPGRSLPAARTREPRRPSIQMFMPDEVRTALASFNNVPDFTTWLNKQMLERVHG